MDLSLSGSWACLGPPSSTVIRSLHGTLLIVMWQPGGEFGGEERRVLCIAESLCCLPETTTTLFISYTSSTKCFWWLKKKQKLKKKKELSMESIFQAGMVVEEGGKSASSVPWKKNKTKQNKTSKMEGNKVRGGNWRRALTPSCVRWRTSPEAHPGRRSQWVALGRRMKEPS